MPQSQAVTILLVSDDADHVEKLEQTLRQTHIANPLIILREGQEALNYLFQTYDSAGKEPPPPGLLLLDLTLPGLDGMHILTRLQADNRTRDLPVMLLTALDDAQEGGPGAAHGNHVWVPTPVTHAPFVAAIRKLGLFLAVIMPASRLSCAD